jgi:hypothetical protein
MSGWYPKATPPAVQLPTGNIGFYAATGNPISWTPDGRIAFISNESGTSDVWLMDTAQIGSN